MQGRLTEYFLGIASKVLSAVETGKSDRHHQHEFNGVSPLKAMLGTERREFRTTFLYLGDDDNTAQDTASMTWYDSRIAHPTRSEFRLYFTTEFIPDHANPGDIMIMGLRPDQSILVIVCARDSAFVGCLLWLFGIDRLGDRFAFRDEEATDRIAVAPAMQLVLAQLGIEPSPSIETGMLDLMREKFGDSFPTTRAFSKFARETLSDAVSVEDPDIALVAWITHEERLFRTFERYIVGKRLDDGFTGDNRVDDFVSYSLHVHNRRKSRAGSALENHMEYLLTERRIRFERGVRTEGRAKPDFLFPGSREYHDRTFPVELLTMLGSKTTAKDRWRQILAEADRISTKHLLTLQPGISGHQLQEMEAHHVIPVIPQGIRETYPSCLQSNIICVSDFIEIVSRRQDHRAT